MIYHQLKFSTAAKCDMSQTDYYEKISSGINFLMRLSEMTKQLHTTNGFKGYCFYIREMLPIKTGQMFHLIIRCYGDKLSKEMTRIMLQNDNDYFICQKLIENEKFEYNPFVKRLTMKTVSPVVVKEKEGNYLDFSDKEKLITAIGNNIIRKYNNVFKTDETENPIEDIKVLSKRLIVAHYKKASIPGRKLLIKFKDDELSQKMAFLAMPFGVGEKNSLGFGCCFANNEYQYEF